MGGHEKPAMIERLWWSAGFGARPRDRGGRRTHADLVHEFLHRAGATLRGPEPRADGRPHEHANSRPDVLWWSRMVARRHPWRAHDLSTGTTTGRPRTTRSATSRLMSASRRTASATPSATSARWRARWCRRSHEDLARPRRLEPTRRPTNFARESSSCSPSARTTAYRTKDIRESARALNRVPVRLRHERVGSIQAARWRHEAHPRPGAFVRRRRRPSAENRHHAPTCARSSGLLLAALRPPRLITETRRRVYAVGHEIAPVRSLIIADGAL